MRRAETAENRPEDWKEQANRWDRFHYVRVAVIIGALAAFLIAISVPLPISTHDWWLFPLLLALIVPLLLRRRYPIQVFALICAAALIQWLTIPQIGVYDVAVLVALYSVAAHRDQQWSVPALAIALGGGFLPGQPPAPCATSACWACSPRASWSSRCGSSAAAPAPGAAT